MCHCGTYVEGENKICPIKEKETGHESENPLGSSDFWPGIVCSPGAVKIEDLDMMFVQMESHGPTAPAHETLENDITKSHEREEKPLNCVPGWQHIAIPSKHPNYRPVHAPACCDIVQQVGTYQGIKDPKEEEKGKNMPCSLWFELSPNGGPGTDGDSLDHAEETGGADGKAPCHPCQINHSFTADIS